jgi:hypothetical protein
MASLTKSQQQFAMHGQMRRENEHQCEYGHGFRWRCDRMDTKPILLTMPEGDLLVWHCPLHYASPLIEQSWLHEGWTFAY